MPTGNGRSGRRNGNPYPNLLFRRSDASHFFDTLTLGFSACTTSIKKAEARSLFRKSGVQFPGVPLQGGLIHSVFDARANVNRKWTEQTQKRQCKRWFGKSKVDGKQMTVGAKALRHGLDRRLKANGAATAHIGERLKRAIVINEADPRLHENLCFAGRCKGQHTG